MQNFAILHPVVKKFFAKEQTDRHTGNFIYIDSVIMAREERGCAKCVADIRSYGLDNEVSFAM